MTIHHPDDHNRDPAPPQRQPRGPPVMTESPFAPATGQRRRRLRAVLAADVANFTGLVSVNETFTLEALSVAQGIAREELAEHSGWLFGMPGDGIFALFESAVDALHCALDIQSRSAEIETLRTVRFRIGVHLGEVLFQDDLPFGEALVIAARLESAADPGGILVSEAVRDAVAQRISASFQERGFFSPKNSPRRVAAFSVCPDAPRGDLNKTLGEGLDRTLLSSDSKLPERPCPGGGVPAASPPRQPVPVLPKAPQLIVKPMTEEVSSTEPPADPVCAAETLSPDRLEKLTVCLTSHVGPVARVLVRRHASTLASPAELIEALANEIPAQNERLEFSAAAHNALARPRA